MTIYKREKSARVKEAVGFCRRLAEGVASIGSVRVLCMTQEQHKH